MDRAASFFSTPQSDPAAMVLGMLPAAQLCLMAQINRASAHLARRDMLWTRLYQQRWATRVGIPASRSPGRKDFRIRHLIERAPAQFARSDPDERFRFCLTVKRRLERPVPPDEPVNPPAAAPNTLDAHWTGLRHTQVMTQYLRELLEYKERLRVFESELSGEDADGPYQSVFDGTITSPLEKASGPHRHLSILNDEYLNRPAEFLNTTQLREQLKQYRASLYVQRTSDGAMACIWADQPADTWTQAACINVFGSSEIWTPEFCPVDFVADDSGFIYPERLVPAIENAVLDDDFCNFVYVTVSLNTTDPDTTEYTTEKPLEPLWPWPAFEAKVRAMLQVYDSGPRELSMHEFRTVISSLNFLS